MALKHVRSYYLQCQEQYMEMVNDAKDFDDALKKGLVDQTQFDQAQVLLHKVKENYERLSYIMYLFLQPNRDKKVAKFNKQNKNLHNHISTSNYSSEAVISENDDILKEFKKLVKEIKK
jgi:iron uptake system EfeUOB component EfeO/EfeM